MTETIKGLLPEWAFVRMIRANRAWRGPPYQKWARGVYARMGSPGAVRAGPFRGMAYLDEASGSGLLPKLLGTYEMEVHPAIEAMVARGPDVLVDVGAAEGYYAVGLARRLPTARVIAYDTDRYARHLLGRMRAANGVGDRVEMRGFCSAAELEVTLAAADRPAVVSDCEGFEDQLLDPGRAPALRRTEVLVEVHEGMSPGVGARLRQRFEATHRIDAYPARPRTGSDCSVETGLSPGDLTDALDEHRWDTSGWFHLTPRAG